MRTVSQSARFVVVDALGEGEIKITIQELAEILYPRLERIRIQESGTELTVDACVSVMVDLLNFIERIYPLPDGIAPTMDQARDLIKLHAES